MSDFRFEEIENLIRGFSTLRDEYVSLNKRRDEVWEKLSDLKKQIEAYLNYHGLEARSTRGDNSAYLGIKTDEKPTLSPQTKDIGGLSDG